MTFRQKVWHFFEDSQTTPAVVVRLFIVVLILFSAGTALIEFTRPELLSPLADYLVTIEYSILAVFTLEYLLRLWASPKKITFFINVYNLIDLIAIVPFYLGIGNPSAVRTLRTFRLLRIARLFRVLRLYKAFKFRGTILQKVTPLALTLISLKAVLIYLERIGYWFTIDDMSTLFTIIGFALGVVLSSKVTMSYKKYISIEETLYKMQGKLSSMMYNLNSFGEGTGTKVIHSWLTGFLDIYSNPSEGSMRKLVWINEKLYQSVKELGNSELLPHHRLAALLKEIFMDANYILGRKTTYVPGAYDKLLQQVLLIYLLLVALFIPGFQGLMAALLGTYLLYGLYYVTVDFDLSDKDQSLIRLEAKRLKNFTEEIGERVGEES